ncbi:hypothetical protein LPJ57_004186 [Coemansia sp. RSA 486]|nr:hypothetical protein LPJ57_004186 [Coemansia sp. RSA 486]KAJ2233277.1 hypothetical protein IWW45_004307 [Coemansia sp. RSA 485]KAJ2637897.1 hypothetical protein GGF40_002050 [Coemansia sp. RSA 1286]
MLYRTDMHTRTKRRRSDSSDSGYLATEVGEPLCLHDAKRLRSTALQDWKSQAMLEAQMPQWLPTPPSMDVDAWPESPQHSWRHSDADGHLHQWQSHGHNHHSHHMALRSNSNPADCDGSHSYSQDQNNYSSRMTGASHDEPSFTTTSHLQHEQRNGFLQHISAQSQGLGSPATPSLSPQDAGNFDGYEDESDDAMDDSELDPSSEYYQINMLLNQLHRERALRKHSRGDAECS